METKEVLLTFLRGREYLFSLYHKLLGAEPTRELVEAACSDDSLKVVGLFDSEDNDAAKRMQEVLGGCRGADEEKLSRMKDEYTRLFFGPEDMIAPPWESVYTSKDRALFQMSTLAVRNWYEKYHYLPAAYPRFPDDHISLMMHFLELTTGKAIQYLEDERLPECRNILEGQKLFEEKHLLNWVPSYAADMQQSPTKEFYPAFAGALSGMLAYDKSVLEEILEILSD